MSFNSRPGGAQQARCRACLFFLAIAEIAREHGAEH
jgi:hypothetical protein